ncbi:sigma-70 family RNA polymerase sigma factor [Geomicrobium sp. JCM 19039]|uniref:sigma-70 family RNA polymerase sigma factor n=1 Tax=Geomicrobium sp. JCM 19039 TaxID=1460636 RepID=UPI00045F32D0|nr:sigma-70 family RNA polymerase sigma factor [Geomicrobium sp. JCM 19039]GAK12622.1 RNA polymerase sigma factor SigW [Geomicrobium sp. JCM 19039]
MDEIKRAKKGDELALTQLLLDHYDIVYHYLLKLTLHPQMAEDLTQESFIKAIERIKQFNPKKAAFSTWLIQIGTNLWRDELRKEKRRKRYTNDRQLEWEMREEPTADWLAVTSALENIKPKERIPLILKHYYGYGYDEIAKIVGIPSGTAKSRVHNDDQSEKGAK